MTPRTVRAGDTLRDRALRGRIVRPERLNRVADEFEPNRTGFAGRKDVHDAAAHGEFTVLVGGIFAAEARVEQKAGEVGRGDLLPGLETERGIQ